MTERLTYRINELADALGVSRITIDRKIKSGELRTTKALGPVLIYADSVNALLGAGTQGKPPSPAGQETSPMPPSVLGAGRSRRRVYTQLPSGLQ